MKLLPKFGAELHHQKLKNGSELFLFYRKGMPIHLRAVFVAGSRFDEIPGTSHYLEHMLVAGTKKFPGKNLLADYIHSIGGEFAANTDTNFIRLMVDIPDKDDIDIGIDFLNECLTQPLFDPLTIENERGAIISELKHKHANPRDYIWEVSKRVSLQGTSAQNSILGDETSVKAITREHLMDSFANLINFGRVHYIASGDISIQELGDKLNGIKLPSGDKYLLNKRLPIIRDKKVDIEHYPGNTQLQVFLSNRTEVDSYKEFCALRVLNSILAAGRGSRLATRLRYEKGLVYSVMGSAFDAGDWGLVRIQYSADKENLEKINDIIFKEFENLIEKNISLAEFELAKSKVAKGSILGMQTSISWVNFHENRAVFSPDQVQTLEDYIDTIQYLTLDDIHDVIRKYLVKDHWMMAICGEYQK